MSTDADKDDEILASILAGSEMTKRPLSSGGHFLGDHGIHATDPEGPCCAIGAGILYRALDRSKLSNKGAIETFVKYYAVSKTYACGVSDGFETGATGHVYMNCEPPNMKDRIDKKSNDYQRGFAVGAAVRASLVEVSTLDETC